MKEIKMNSLKSLIERTTSFHGFMKYKEKALKLHLMSSNSFSIKYLLFWDKSTMMLILNMSYFRLLFICRKRKLLFSAIDNSLLCHILPAWHQVSISCENVRIKKERRRAFFRFNIANKEKEERNDRECMLPSTMFIFYSLFLLHHFQMRWRAADILFGRKIFFCEKYSTSPVSLHATKYAYELFLEQQQKRSNTTQFKQWKKKKDVDEQYQNTLKVETWK